MSGASSRRIATARVAVWLTVTVALLSVVTGVANIGTREFTGPLATSVPDSIQQTAGFTGTLTGFLMVAAAAGMLGRLRAAWYATLALLPVTAVQGLLQASVLSLSLVVLSLLALPSVLLARQHFDRGLDLTTTQLAAAALLTVQAYGTAGTYALRDEYEGVSTLLDAL